MTEGERYMCF